MFDRVTMKYDGNYYEWSVNELDMPVEGATDDQIKTAALGRLMLNGVASANLNEYIVDPPQLERLSGMHNDKIVLNIRPTALYGNVKL